MNASSTGTHGGGGDSRPTHDEVERLVAGIEGVSLGAIFALRRAPDGWFSLPFASPIIEDISGISRHELAHDASALIRTIHAADLNWVLASLAESAEKLTDWKCEFKVNTQAKGSMWLEGCAVPQRDQQGGTVWYGCVSGITARKRAESAVYESEQKFRAYFENASIAILIVSSEGRILDCNPAGEQMLGYDMGVVTGKTVFDLHQSADHHEVRARLDALAAGGPVDAEVRWLRSNGAELWVLLRAVPLRGGRTIAFCQDISERKRAELESLRSRELLEAFIDHAPVGIAMFDRSLRYIRSSRKWQAVMAATATTLAGRHHYEDVSEMPANWIDAHQRGLAGQTVVGEDEWLRPDGKRALHRWQVHPWGDAGIDTGGIIILFEDVTEARTMEAELRHAHKMEALGQLAGGVAHDFNNLLQIIFGYTELVQDQLASDRDAAKYTSEVLRAARRASSLTRQLLAFSRRQVFAPAVVDLNGVITNTSKMLKRLLDENVALELTLDEPLWPIEADADQLSQVLINLCVNARDAMPHGGRLTISTSNCRVSEASLAGPVHVVPGEYVMMTVADTGAGMTAEVMHRIFEPFFTTKEVGKGTGLGLSAVYGIVRQSNGHVWPESAPGKGTRFTVCLPRTDKPVIQIPFETRKPAAGGNQTLLVVEDDPDVRQAVATYLPTLGYTVLAAFPSDALHLAKQHAGAIDLLITDVVMPGISGPELAKKVRALQPGLPILYMSGHIDDAVTRHGVLESKSPFLQKPFNLSELAAAIREALAQS